MSTVEDFFYDRLSGDAAVSAIVGARIYRIKMPDNPTLPAITYYTSYGDTIEDFKGYGGMKMPVMVVDCWARSAGAAQDLAEKVRLALHGYSGTSGDKAIANILEWSTTELFDGDLEIFHIACSMRVWYS